MQLLLDFDFFPLLAAFSTSHIFNLFLPLMISGLPQYLSSTILSYETELVTQVEYLYNMESFD